MTTTPTRYGDLLALTEADLEAFLPVLPADDLQAYLIAAGVNGDGAIVRLIVDELNRKGYRR